MSPVKQSTNRSAVVAVAGLLVALAGLVALVVFVVFVQSGTEAGKVEVRSGTSQFDVGPADSRAATIAESGPLLFSDVASGERDIYVQHIGTDPAAGWLAFDARTIDSSRDCTLRWSAERTVFENPCDGSTVPADGEGLRHYDVTVTNDGHVVVDLSSGG